MSAPVQEDHDALSDRVAAQGVRDLLDGKLTGPPLPGTLADRVHQALDSAEEDAIWRGFR